MNKSHILTLPISSSWAAALDQWELVLRAGGRSERTVETRIRHMRQVARGLALEDPDMVTPEGLLEWCGQQEWAAETRHAYYASIRGFFSWRTHHQGEDPSRVLPQVRRSRGAPRPVPAHVLDKALATASGRDRLILSLAASAGLRASEIAQVHRDDLVDDLAGRSLLVRGKGDRIRAVPLPDWLASEVETACTCSRDGWAFPSKYGGHLSGAHISKLGAKALPSPWTLHTLRHRFATAAYRGDRDLLAVQRLLGHASVETTQRYAEPPHDALRRAVNAADIHMLSEGNPNDEEDADP